KRSVAGYPSCRASPPGAPSPARSGLRPGHAPDRRRRAGGDRRVGGVPGRRDARAHRGLRQRRTACGGVRRLHGHGHRDGEPLHDRRLRLRYGAARRCRQGAPAPGVHQRDRPRARHRAHGHGRRPGGRRPERRGDPHGEATDLRKARLPAPPALQDLTPSPNLVGPVPTAAPARQGFALMSQPTSRRPLPSGASRISAVPSMRKVSGWSSTRSTLASRSPAAPSHAILVITSSPKVILFPSTFAVPPNELHPVEPATLPSAANVMNAAVPAGTELDAPAETNV